MALAATAGADTQVVFLYVEYCLSCVSALWVVSRVLSISSVLLVRFARDFKSPTVSVTTGKLEQNQCLDFYLVFIDFYESIDDTVMYCSSSTTNFVDYSTGIKHSHNRERTTV